MAEGHATTIVFGTSGFAANLLEIGGMDVSRGFYETTHMGTTVGKTFAPADLYDAGGVDITFKFAAGNSVPIAQANETITIDWGGDGSTWAFDGFMTDYSPQASSGEDMIATARLKASGSITGI